VPDERQPAGQSVKPGKLRETLPALTDAMKLPPSTGRSGGGIDSARLRAPNLGRTLAMPRTARLLLVLLGLVLSAGCHTSMRRPPACCQYLENRCGDAVDHVGRMTSISNPRINHRVTAHYRGW